MTDEHKRILQMVADGKISAADAERLIDAIDEPATPPSDSGGGLKAKPRYLRINVKKRVPWTDTSSDQARGTWGWPGFGAKPDNKDVNIRVPLAIVRSGMRLAAMIPGLEGRSAKLRNRGIEVDLSKLDPEAIESMLDEMGELNIDVDSGKAQVRITCE